MHKVFAVSAALFSVFTAVAFAQVPAGFDQFYEAPTRANLGGRWVEADIALYADMAAAENGELRVALVTEVTKFIAETERDLENWVATHQERCGERWDAGKPFIGFPPGQIQFAVDLELEVWNCGLLGRGEPGRMAREGGRVDVILDPYVENGRLQARLADFSVDNRIGVSKYLPLEFVAKRVIDGELKNLNQNRKFYRAPQPLYGEGFSYESIRGTTSDDGRVWITAIYRADGDTDTLERLADKMRDDGVTQ